VDCSGDRRRGQPAWRLTARLANHSLTAVSTAFDIARMCRRHWGLEATTAVQVADGTKHAWSPAHDRVEFWCFSKRSWILCELDCGPTILAFAASFALICGSIRRSKMPKTRVYADKLWPHPQCDRGPRSATALLSVISERPAVSSSHAGRAAVVPRHPARRRRRRRGWPRSADRGRDSARAITTRMCAAADDDGGSLLYCALQRPHLITSSQIRFTSGTGRRSPAPTNPRSCHPAYK
jgi:hypothetical protein